MRVSSFLKVAVCLLALAFAIGGVASSQEQGQDQGQGQSQSPDQDPTGGIRGTISNSSGEGIPDARITASGGPGPAADITADNAGDYFVKLPPGTYKVIISAQGFKAFQQDVEVNAEMVEVDAMLEPDPDAKPAQQVLLLQTRASGDN